MSLNHLKFTFPKIDTLESWIIDEELITLSNHEMIVFDPTNLDDIVGRMTTSYAVTV